MIVTRANYDTVIEYLNRRDTRRNPHRLPLERYTWSDCEYLFTLCARQCGQPFRDPALATAIIDALLWRKTKQNWFMFCLCLMPDHLHFIIQFTATPGSLRNVGVRGFEPESILHQLADFKSYTTSQLWWKMGRSGPLWQQSSDDRVIRDNDSVDHAVSYVLNNPVRTGIVAEWHAYPYGQIVDEW